VDEQLRAELLREAVKLQTDRSGRQVNLLRRACHTGRVHHCKKQFKLVDVHRYLSTGRRQNCPEAKTCARILHSARALASSSRFSLPARTKGNAHEDARVVEGLPVLKPLAMAHASDPEIIHAKPPTARRCPFSTAAMQARVWETLCGHNASKRSRSGRAKHAVYRDPSVQENGWRSLRETC
jgi:hypothetical protein